MINDRGLLQIFLPGLSRHFALWVLVFGMFFAALMAAFSIVFSFSAKQAEVRGSVAELVEKSLPSISTSVYTIDAEQLRIQLDSLLFNPHIEFAQVTEIRANRKIYTSRGVVPEGYDFIVEMPLSYRLSNGLREDYGQLSVIATFNETYKSMARSAAGLFLSNAVMVFLLIIIVHILLRTKVLRHTNHLATLHEDLCVDNLGQRFEFDRPSTGLNRPDELDRLLVSANICRRQFFNQMSAQDSGETGVELDYASHKIWDRENLAQILDTAIARSDVMNDPFVYMLFQVGNVFDRRSDHMSGQLLHVVAKRTMGKVLQSRTIASADENSVRIAQAGENQFAVVVSKVANPTHCISIAERLLELFEKDIIIGARTIKPVISFGICICPQDGKSREALLASAEYALQLATKKTPESAFEMYKKT